MIMRRFIFLAIWASIFSLLFSQHAFAQTHSWGDIATINTGGSTDGSLCTYDATGKTIICATASAGQWSNGASGAIYYNGGNVGIGTTAPGAKLTVQSTSTSSGATVGGNTSVFLDDNNSHFIQFGAAATANTGILFGNPTTYNIGSIIYSNAANTLTIAANPGTVTTFASGGVGIGTTTPGAKLDVQGTGDNKFFNYETSGVGYVYGHIKNSGGTTILATEGSVAGNVLVGSLAYASALGSVGAKALQLGTDQTARLTILPTSGNVGIGTTAPAEKLEVSGNAKVSGSLQTTDAGTTCAAAGDLGKIRYNSATGRYQICAP